jgi:glycosyltransferase involved in cell wall biosynthesis
MPTNSQELSLARQADITQPAVSARPIRVLLWSPYGSGEHYHGPGSFAYRLYRHAPAGRFEVTLAHGAVHQSRHALFADQHLIHPFDGKTWSTWRFLRESRAWIAAHAHEYDVFHGLSGFQATIDPAYRATRVGLPAVVFLSTGNIELADKPGLKGLLGLPKRRRAMASQLGALIVMSDSVETELLRFGFPKHKIARIPMGVNTDEFRPVESESERQRARAASGWPERPTVIFVGGVTTNKRAHLLIEALAQPRAEHWQLVIVGPEHEPEYAVFARKRAAELNVESRVIWHGFTNNPAPLYRAADVFCLPSQNEGMPAALVEAMASGLPAVITPVPGMMELVQDGVHGHVVPPDAGRIADAIHDYLGDPGKATRHGATARQRSVEGFSTKSVVQAYEALFRRVMKSSAQRSEAVR